MKLHDSKGRAFLIDEEDFSRVSKHLWYVNTRPSGYAIVRTYKGKRLGKFVLNTEREVDHINRDPCDNRKSNLRIVSHQQNQINRNTPSHNTSGYRGIWYDRPKSKWRAELRSNGKRFFGGRFPTKEVAAAAYNQLALKHHGEFARLNEV
jgi:HNH endonuclease/AP2 domain